MLTLIVTRVEIFTMIIANYHVYNMDIDITLCYGIIENSEKSVF